MKQWNSDKKIWKTFSSKQSLQEVFNVKEFIELLKKSQINDFGNIFITFEPNEILEFRFVKESNTITFDSGILDSGRSEYNIIIIFIKFYDEVSEKK